MVLTWIGDVRPLLDESCYLRYRRQVPAFRREKADRLKSPAGRALSIGVWVLWQRARKECGLPPDAPFNLSHSGTYALCSAAADGQAQVGCDVERISVFREGIARRFFCPGEYAHIRAQADPDGQRELFFRYWVLKESFIKATRRGMALPLDSFAFELRDGADPALAFCPAPYQREDYHFREFDLEGYRAAVCSTDPTIDARLRWMTY